ncbi:hypothetical protein L3V77_10630 [Vibrio sp. DW001]|uniref:hypothetical protein n=1 Tax=Vibrio sp. DW001 TaxID=2912315 RepID=UPI0023AEB534|nr:hypothetical protein [Vibrio sp. DW001]WED25522.1 hypothetical protein L3V77_10630 [Vibrio sp. DW001]
MNTKANIKCVIYEYECKCCGQKYRSPIYKNGYGQFLLRSYNSNGLAWLDAISDPAYKEMGMLLRNNPKVTHLKQRTQSDIFHKIVGCLYDPDLDGGYFGIGIAPKCPHCDQRDVHSCQEVEPIEFVNLRVPIITATRWSSLSLKEKEDKINNSLTCLDM